MNLDEKPSAPWNYLRIGHLLESIRTRGVFDPNDFCYLKNKEARVGVIEEARLAFPGVFERRSAKNPGRDVLTARKPDHLKENMSRVNGLNVMGSHNMKLSAQPGSTGKITPLVPPGGPEHLIGAHILSAGYRMDAAISAEFLPIAKGLEVVGANAGEYPLPEGVDRDALPEAMRAPIETLESFGQRWLSHSDERPYSWSDELEKVDDQAAQVLMPVDDGYISITPMTAPGVVKTFMDKFATHEAVRKGRIKRAEWQAPVGKIYILNRTITSPRYRRVLTCLPEMRGRLFRRAWALRNARYGVLFGRSRIDKKVNAYLQFIFKNQGPKRHKGWFIEARRRYEREMFKALGEAAAIELSTLSRDGQARGALAETAADPASPDIPELFEQARSYLIQRMLAAKSVVRGDNAVAFNEAFKGHLETVGFEPFRESAHTHLHPRGAI